MRKNLSTCGFEDKAVVIGADFEAALGRLMKQGAIFDLVFVDPPYKGTLRDAALARLGPLLAPDGWVVVETATTEEAPLVPQGCIIDTERKFGQTKVFLFRYA